MRNATVAGLLILLSLAAYVNVFGNGFAFDDHPAITRNAHVRNFQLERIFTSSYWAGVITGETCEEDPCIEAAMREQKPLYRPLVSTTYAINFALGGFNTFGYHLVNLLLHAVVTLAFYGLARQLRCSMAGAFAGAAVFAVHPLHTEAVTGIVGRAELLMALGVLLALRWYIQSGAPERFDAKFAVASWAAFLLAVLSKEQALILPGVILLYDLFAVKDRSWSGLLRGALRRYSGFIVILCAMLAVRTFLFNTVLYGAGSHTVFIDNPLVEEGGWVRVLTAIKVSGKYLWLFLWPERLSADYSYNAIPVARSLLEPGVLWTLVAWAALLAVAVGSYLWARRVVFFAVGFTVVTFLPASNLIVPIGTIMGERLFYLPSAGLCLMIAAAWDRAALWAGREGAVKPLKWAGVGVVSAALVLLAARTLIRNRDWMNNHALMESAIRVVPQSAKVNYLVGLSRRDRGESGLKQIERAIEIYPDYPLIIPAMAKNYGRALLAEGRIEEAIYRLERAVDLNPGVRDGYYYLGVAYIRSGLWKEAEEAIRKTLRTIPRHAEAYNNLSFVLWRQGRYAEALEAAEAALRLKKGFAEAHYNKAVIFESMGRAREAVASYEETLRIKPIASARARLDKLLTAERAKIVNGQR